MNSTQCLSVSLSNSGDYMITIGTVDYSGMFIWAPANMLQSLYNVMM